MAEELSPQSVQAQQPSQPDGEGDFLAVQIASGSSFTGPIPPPEILMGYEEIQPGLAMRIVEMAELEQVHQHQLAEQQIAIARSEYADASSRSKMGLYLGAAVAIAFVAATAAIAYFGHAWPAAALGASSVASIAGVFVYGSRVQQQESSEDRP